MNFFAELKRRKVFKVGAAYLVVAWLVVQAASIGFPAFDAPPWALRIFILIALLGFPIAVVMAWVLDVTPEGVKLDVGTSGIKRLFAVAALLIVLALGWYFYGQPSFRKGDVTTPLKADQKSIAVLPFANMSADKNDEYLSDGVSEELITALSKITGLQVKARTSSFMFKGKNEDIQKIGELLHVSHLLEGSVAKAGNKLRITAQLIQTSDGNHEWSDTYDREMQDIFAVRSEVAQKVAETLKIRLLGEEKRKIDKKPTENIEAYNLTVRDATTPTSLPKET